MVFPPLTGAVILLCLPQCAYYQKVSMETTRDVKMFLRKDGILIAHKMYLSPMTKENASAQCLSDGGFLAGVESFDEAQVLSDLAKDAHQGSRTFWMGGLRKEECKSVDKYEEDENSACSRNNSVAWEHDIARRFDNEWWRDNSNNSTNPSSLAEKPQLCLQFVHGNPAWARVDHPGFLDDVECSGRLPFFCSFILTTGGEVPSER